MKKILIPIVSLGAVLVTALVGGCSWPPVHKIEVQQGNILTQEDINRLKPGMTERQVRYLLGNPLINDPFHNNRWDYYYSLEQKGKRVQEQRVTLYFDKGLLTRIEGDLRPDPNAEPSKVDQRTVVTVNPPVKEKKGIIEGILGRVGLETEDP